MFYINKNPILADELEILETLKAHLEINGIYLFNQFKHGTNNIQFNCPIHNNGQESKPSCGIRTTNDKSIQSGTVHCFTCGYTASLEKMISDCFGRDDGGQFGRDWLVKNFLSVAVEDRPLLDLNFSRGKEVNIQEYISEQELQNYRYYHDYMYKRRLTDELIELYDIGYDDNFEFKDKNGVITAVYKCVTFPVRDIMGRTLFIARRSVDTKFFNYPVDVLKPVYGLYELPESYSEVIVCESMFNAITSTLYGRPAVALLGLGTEYQYEQLANLQCRKLIFALDPDVAGEKATLKAKEYFKGKKIVTSFVLPDGKDINDLEKEEFDSLPEIF